MTPEIQTPSPFALLTIARQADCAAGEHVLANLNRRGEADSLTRSDVKHRLDVEAQEVATATILAACPDYPILGVPTRDWAFRLIPNLSSFGCPCSWRCRFDGQASLGGLDQLQYLRGPGLK